MVWILLMALVERVLRECQQPQKAN